MATWRRTICTFTMFISVISCIPYCIIFGYITPLGIPTAFTLAISACQAFGIYSGTTSREIWRFQKNRVTAFGASWNPSVPFTWRITYMSPVSLPTMLSCHSISLLMVGNFGRKFPPCWRCLRNLNVIYCCEVCFDFCATKISLHFISSAKYF